MQSWRFPACAARHQAARGVCAADAGGSDASPPVARGCEHNRWDSTNRAMVPCEGSELQPNAIGEQRHNAVTARCLRHLEMAPAG
jgi:hypothetical protein